MTNKEQFSQLVDMFIELDAINQFSAEDANILRGMLSKLASLLGIDTPKGLNKKSIPLTASDKSKIWPPIDFNAERAKGVDAGAAYIKWRIWDSLANKKPLKHKAKAAYNDIIQIIRDSFMPAKSYVDITTSVYSSFLNKLVKQYPQLNTSEIHALVLEAIGQKAMDVLMSTNSKNQRVFIKNKDTDKQTFIEALDYAAMKEGDINILNDFKYLKTQFSKKIAADTEVRANEIVGKEKELFEKYEIKDILRGYFTYGKREFIEVVNYLEYRIDRTFPTNKSDDWSWTNKVGNYIQENKSKIERKSTESKNHSSAFSQKNINQDRLEVYETIIDTKKETIYLWYDFENYSNKTGKKRIADILKYHKIITNEEYRIYSNYGGIISNSKVRSFRSCVLRFLLKPIMTNYLKSGDNDILEVILISYPELLAISELPGEWNINEEIIYVLENFKTEGSTIKSVRGYLFQIFPRELRLSTDFYILKYALQRFINIAKNQLNKDTQIFDKPTVTPTLALKHILENPDGLSDEDFIGQK